jgi:hypothetical protein
MNSWMKSSERASEWPAAARNLRPRNSWIYYRSVLNGERYTRSPVNNPAARPSLRSPINADPTEPELPGFNGSRKAGFETRTYIALAGRHQQNRKSLGSGPIVEGWAFPLILGSSARREGCSLRSALHQRKPSLTVMMSRSVIFACLAQLGDFMLHPGPASAQVARDRFYWHLAREHVTKVNETHLRPAHPGIHLRLPETRQSRPIVGRRRPDLGQHLLKRESRL